MQASLVMFKADGTRRDFPLKEGTLIVGRKTSCELRIPLSSVSRQHCEMSVEGETIKLRDLGSSNGTFHNSIRVQEAELAAGDEVVIGPVVFTVVVDGVPGDIKPVRSIVGSQTRVEDQQQGSGSGSDVLEMTESGGQEALAMPDISEDSDPTPTVDLDDDPIAALEAMAEDEFEVGGDESSVIEFNFDDLGDDDDDD